MEEINELTEEELTNITGGTRPEEVGEPKTVYIYPSYIICPKCGACMFLKTVKFKNKQPFGATYHPCSECGYQQTIIPVMDVD